MNLKVTIVLPLLLLLLLPYSGWGKSDVALINNDMRVAHSRCLNYGEVCKSVDERLEKDKAIIVKLSSSRNYSEKELQSLGDAYKDMANLCMFHFYDYSRALEYLIKARQYYGDNPPTGLLISMAHLCNFYSECIPTMENIRSALDYYHQAFQQAVKNKEWDVAYNAFNNVCCMGFTPELMEYNKSMIDKFNVLPPIKNTRLMKFTQYSYRFTVALRDSQWDKASNVFHEILAYFKPNQENSRYRAEAYSDLAEIAIIKNQPDSLYYYAKLLEKITQKYTNPDVQTDVSLYLSRYYMMTGDTTRAKFYKLEYFEQRDSLLYEGNLVGVRTAFLSNRLQDAGSEIKLIRQRLYTRNLIMAISLVSLCIIIVMLVWLHKKNQELKQRNVELYRHNIAYLKREKEQQEMLQQLEQSRKCKTDASGEKSSAEKSHAPCSALSEEEKTTLRYKMEELMNDPSIISKTDFNIDQLAMMCDVSSKVLSCFINETLNRSFSVLLSESRIKEACKRINDFERYGNLTIEAISQSVGFSSRGGFIRAFKRVTGLTPSEYLSIARNQSKVAQESD